MSGQFCTLAMFAFTKYEGESMEIRAKEWGRYGQLLYFTIQGVFFFFFFKGGLEKIILFFSCTWPYSTTLCEQITFLVCKEKSIMVFQLIWTVSLLFWGKGIRVETSEYVSYSLGVEIFRICQNTCHPPRIHIFQGIFNKKNSYRKSICSVKLSKYLDVHELGKLGLSLLHVTFFTVCLLWGFPNFLCFTLERQGGWFALPCCFW